MKKIFLLILVLSISFSVDINLDHFFASKYYLGQLDRFENFKVCFYSSNYSGFFVTNISKDIRFLKEKNCIYVYSLKNSSYGKKFITVKFLRCLDPFDYDICFAYNNGVRTLKLVFDLKKSYLINVRYNRTGYIHQNISILITISGKSLGKSNFDIKNLRISPKKYKEYSIKKKGTFFYITYYPVIEDKYSVCFDIIRNNFEKTHICLNETIQPTIIGKIKNIKTGALLIPSYLQGFYSLLSLFIS